MLEVRAFAKLEPPLNIWAVGSIRGDAERLKRLHLLLESRMADGDKLVYLGNILGRGPAVRDAVEEVARFRNWFVARQDGDAESWVALRGRQEALFDHLLNLDKALNPVGTIVWTLDQGVGPAIVAYGGDPQEGVEAAAVGPHAVRAWTAGLWNSMAESPGHAGFFRSLKNAAYTANNAVVFVHAGLLCDRPLDAQGDSLWWNSSAFGAAKKPYYATLRVVRGFDPESRGVVETKYSVSVDGGSGRGGKLYAVKLDRAGRITDMVSA